MGFNQVYPLLVGKFVEWKPDGMLAVEEFLEQFHIEEAPAGNSHRIGGFVITHLGKIPTATDKFDGKGLLI
jgi:putative hemolysin